MSGMKRGKRGESILDKPLPSEKDIFYRLLEPEVAKIPNGKSILDQIGEDNLDIVTELAEKDIDPDILQQTLEEVAPQLDKIKAERARLLKEEEQLKTKEMAAPSYSTNYLPSGHSTQPYGAMSAERGRPSESPAMYEKRAQVPEASMSGITKLSPAPSRMTAAAEEMSVPRGVPKGGVSELVSGQSAEAADFAKYQSIIQINQNRLKQKLAEKLKTTRMTKVPSKSFVETLHLGFMTYFRNTMDELIKLSVIENDTEFKQFTKDGEGDEGLNSHLFETKNEKLVLTDLGDAETDVQVVQPQFFLVKTNHLPDDQKLIDDFDNKEKDKLKTMSESTSASAGPAGADATAAGAAATGATSATVGGANQTGEGGEEKIVKKLKKEENEYIELIKHLFRNKAEKEKDSENENKKVEEANKQLQSELFGPIRRPSTGPKNLGDLSLGKDNSTVSMKGKKGQLRRRITAKHLIHYPRE